MENKEGIAKVSESSSYAGLSTLLDRLSIVNNELENACNTIHSIEKGLLGESQMKDKSNKDQIKEGLIERFNLELNRYSFMKEEIVKSVNLISDTLYG